jgi:hypothetical protein
VSKVRELFGHSTGSTRNWATAVAAQQCPFLGRKCLKNRKSEPDIAIGTCTVTHSNKDVVICPHRFLERDLIFNDAAALIRHEAGNELHVIPEVGIPGGTVDYFLATTRNGRVRDFVGIEIQTLDTTGTLWPERQRFAQSKGIVVKGSDADSTKSFGMNWKMTAKTILVQLHHKVRTFEEVNRHLVLAIQDVLLDYITGEFTVAHLAEARPAHPLQLHAYSLSSAEAGALSMQLVRRLGTDTEGVAMALGLQEEARVELETIHGALEARISAGTVLRS